jgi:glycosyltransferase involved in cell wall biosynthesis
MDEKDKRIAKLERELLIAKHQLLEFNKIKYELSQVHASRIWKIKSAILSRRMSLKDRFNLLAQSLPLVSNLYSFAKNLFIKLNTKKVDNEKYEGPLITVVIPFYNYYAYIDECMDSIFDQGLGDKVEIIIIEGFSNDGSREKLKERSWPNTRMIFQEERTPIGENRLRGIQEAKGKYVCTMDPDDKMAPNYLKRAIEILEREHYDVVYPDVKNFEDDETEHTVPDFYYDNLFEFNFVTAPSIFRRQFWEEHNIGYSTQRDIFEDWDFWLRMAKAGARFKHLPGFYLLYRIHTTTAPSMTDERLKQQLDKDNKTKEAYKSFIKSKEYFKGKRNQEWIYKVNNSDINLTWLKSQ